MVQVKSHPCRILIGSVGSGFSGEAIGRSILAKGSVHARRPGTMRHVRGAGGGLDN